MSLKKLSVQSQQSKYTIEKKTENLKYSFGSCSGAHESWPRITNSFWLSRKVCAKTTSANISFRFIKKPHGLNLLSYCVQAFKLLKLNYFLLRVLQIHKYDPFYSYCVKLTIVNQEKLKNSYTVSLFVNQKKVTLKGNNSKDLSK